MSYKKFFRSVAIQWIHNILENIPAEDIQPGPSNIITLSIITLTSMILLEDYREISRNTKLQK